MIKPSKLGDGERVSWPSSRVGHAAVEGTAGLGRRRRLARILAPMRTCSPCPWPNGDPEPLRRARKDQNLISALGALRSARRVCELRRLSCRVASGEWDLRETS